MKQTLFLLMAILPFALYAQKTADTIILKNGKTIAGYIYKMEDGAIYVFSNGDSASFSADEVKSLMFCHRVYSKGNSSVVGSSSSESKTSKSSGAGYSNGGKPCDDNIEEKGTVVFLCNMCGGKGSLSIKGGMENSKTTGNYTFELENGEKFTTYKQHLPPGTYNWVYKDTSKNQTKGTFTSKKGEEKKIILFENEN
jgi:hypothetical protein